MGVTMSTLAPLLSMQLALYLSSNWIQGVASCPKAGAAAGGPRPLKHK